MEILHSGKKESLESLIEESARNSVDYYARGVDGQIQMTEQIANKAVKLNSAILSKLFEKGIFTKGDVVDVLSDVVFFDGTVEISK